MTNQKWNIIRIGTGDYAIGKNGPLYKEILTCAEQNGCVSASVFKSMDGFLIHGNQEMVRLFGGIDKSQALIIEVLIKSEIKESFLTSLRTICDTTIDPVVISVSDSEVEVLGL